MNPNDPTRKEVYRIFYREKGHVDVSDDTAYGMFNSYFSRQWDTYEGHAAEYWEERSCKENSNCQLTFTKRNKEEQKNTQYKGKNRCKEVHQRQ